MSQTKSDTPKAKPAKTPWQTEMQERADKEANQGFRGVEVDQTPNENYTIAGVTKGLPTPETERKGDN